MKWVANMPEFVFAIWLDFSLAPSHPPSPLIFYLFLGVGGCFSCLFLGGGLGRSGRQVRWC